MFAAIPKRQTTTRADFDGRPVSVTDLCQRFSLTATHLGLRTSFVNQPVEVARLRPELAALVGTPGRRPDLVRFGYGPELPFAPRRPIRAVLS